MKSINVALIQINSKNKKEENFAKIFELCKSIRRGSVDLITFAENFSCYGDETEDVKFAEHFNKHSAIAFLKDLARSKQAFISGGTISVKVHGSKKIKNRAVLIDPSGELVAQYDKIHMFDVDFDNGTSFKESASVESGKKIVVASTKLGKIGFAICYDLRFPELFRELTLKGAEIILVPSAFITKTGRDHWEVLLRARAIENQVFIVATNQIGSHSSKRHTYGGSVVIDPWGRVLSRGKTNEFKTTEEFPGEIITTRLDKAELIEFRRNIPCLKNRKLL